MRHIEIATGDKIPVFGLGTWRMGEHRNRFDNEIKTIRAAIDMGITLIDTAEMYGEGGAEAVIGEAIQGRRDGLFLVSKFYPHNAGRSNLKRACEQSLRRMDCDVIDLYLYHWPGSAPMSDTFDVLMELKDSGKIKAFGVSNFDLDDLKAIPEEYHSLLGCNQIFYNLAHREVEWKVADWCQTRSIPLMAYSPLDQASSLLESPTLLTIAQRLDATAAQIALAWLLQQTNTIVIPKSSQVHRIEENLQALDIELTGQDINDLDAEFTAPVQPVRLGMR